MKKAFRGPMMVVGFIGLVIVLGLFLGLVIQALWNQTVAPLFDVNPIGYWQSVGIFVLAKILFGLGAGSGPKKKFRSRIKLADGESPADSDFVSEEFQEYWTREGKESYEAFRINKSPSESSS